MDYLTILFEKNFDTYYIFLVLIVLLIITYILLLLNLDEKK
jgi:hypothetical protein